MKRLYYLQRSKANSRFVSGELWETELETGKKQRLLPDFLMEHYDVSPDGKQVIFITADASGRAPLWIGAHRRKFFTAPPFGSGLHSGAFRPGWRNLLRRGPFRRYVSTGDQNRWHRLAQNRAGSSNFSVRYFAGW